jgi:hypothetical protein
VPSEHASAGPWEDTSVGVGGVGVNGTVMVAPAVWSVLVALGDGSGVDFSTAAVAADNVGEGDNSARHPPVMALNKTKTTAIECGGLPARDLSIELLIGRYPLLEYQHAGQGAAILSSL